MLNDTSAWLETEFLNINVESLNVRYKTEHEVYRYCVDLFVTGEAVLLGLPSTEVDLQALLKVSHDNMSVKCFHSTSLVWYILQLYSTCCSFYKIVPVQIWNVKCDIFLHAMFDTILQRQNKRRNTTFGVDFQEQVEKSRSAIPSIVTKCLTEIEKRGIMIKVSLQKNYTTHRLMIENLFSTWKKNPKFWAVIFSSFWVFFVLIILYIYFGVWYTIS